MSKIGIYGGTFNPVHNTHIEIALCAIKQLNLDKLYFLIAGEPPHKNTADDINVFNRLEMLEIALEGYTYFEIDTREIFRTSKSYSYLTIEEYHKEFSDDELFFIMGSDSIFQFEQWVKPEIIAQYANIVIASRNTDSINSIKEHINKLREKYATEYFILDIVPTDISSTAIRNNISSSLDDIPESVYEYIINHNLYNPKYDMEKSYDIASALKKTLKPSRYIHTIGVAHTCYSLACRWGYEPSNAYLAGILHDSAKSISDEERISICEKHNIYISPTEYKAPHLLHGKVGAYWAKSKFNVSDPQIIHAISIHTTGCIDMNLLDKILYIADYIEPNRIHQPRLDMLRKLAYEDIDLCLYIILEDTVSYLQQQNKEIDNTTYQTYLYYKNLRG